MNLNIFELREIDELLRDFDHMLWKADSRQGTSFRLRIHVLVKRLEELMKTYEAAEKKAIEEEAQIHA